MAIAWDESRPIPFAFHCVLVLELMLFVPFTYMHYFRAFHKVEFKVLAQNSLARVHMIGGEMTNGVGACVLMYMIANVLITGRLTRIDVEVFFLSHALWYGVCMSLSAAYPVWLIFALFNPHTYLSILTWVTAYDLPRPQCLVICVGIMLFGLYNHHHALREDVFGGKPWTWRGIRSSWSPLLEHELTAEGTKGFVGMCDKWAGLEKDSPLLEDAQVVDCVRRPSSDGCASGGGA